MEGVFDSAKLGNIDCNLRKTDLTELMADTCLVPNPVDHTGVGGVLEAVRNAGSNRGCEALEVFHEQRPGSMQFGSVLQERSGGGNFKYLTHAASVCNFGGGKAINFAAVVVSVLSALEKMQDTGLKTINIPLMGTGELGWLSDTQSAKAILIGMDRFAKKHPDADIEATICVREQEQFDAVRNVMKNEELYKNVSDEMIFAEEGERVPNVAESQPYVTQDPLAAGLQSRARRSVNGLGGR